MGGVAAVDMSPAVALMGLALVIAMPLLVWLWWRHRGAPRAAKLAALTAFTLFLTFDLVVFGAFTRLTDSGLGCPDWPGCYGEASPLAAHDEIRQAQEAMPTGPVTFKKAWIEMIHRYLAMTVGLMILALAVASWAWRAHLPHSMAWPLATLVWVIAQGLFGKYTVVWKLYPAIVTLHLIGGLMLLAMLVAQREAYRTTAVVMGVGWRRGAMVVLALVGVQVALGAWVSTNYAVLACRGFPDCSGQWGPAMDFELGFTILRELGRAGHGGFLPYDALVAIHMTHRLFAVVVVLAISALVVGLMRQGDAASRRHARWLGAVLLVQLATGASNVVFNWPIGAALAHTAGAAVLVMLLTALIASQRSAAARGLAGARPLPRAV